MVVTPVKSETGADDVSPVAPDAPERPPSAIGTSKRLKTGNSPVLELFPDPPAPTVQVTLQKNCALPVGESLTIKALLTATPPPPSAPDANAEATFHDVFFCVDASDSARANGCMASAKEVLAKFVNSEPPPGVVRRVGMIGFGTHIEDYRTGDLSLMAINSETRPVLLEGIANMRAYHGGTNIGEPVLFAINAIKKSREEDTANDIKSPAVAHVITLTDGACHSCKYANPDVLTREVRETGAPEKGIQTHYIGFGEDIHGDYMKKASDSGKLGVFHAAPGASGKSGLATAFEVVLGFLGCDHTFTFEATQFPYGKEEKTVHMLGALRSERTHLLDVDVRRNATGEFPVLALQMLQNGKPIGERVVASLVFENGQPPQHENADVLEAMKKLEIDKKVQQVLQSASTNHEASQQLRSIAADSGLSSEIQGDVEEIAGACFRSLSAPQVFGAQMASQQAHGYSAPEEEEEEEEEGNEYPAPQWNATLSSGEPLPSVPMHRSLVAFPPPRPGYAPQAAFRGNGGQPGAVEEEEEEVKADDYYNNLVYRNMASAPPPPDSTNYRSLHTVTPYGPTADEEEEEEEVEDEQPVQLRSLGHVPVPVS